MERIRNVLFLIHFLISFLGVIALKRLFIFDFDGTLFDSVDDVVICFNRALEIHGFPTLTHEEYVERLGGNIDEAVSLILGDNSTSENVELIKDTYQKLYDESDKIHTIPFPGVTDFLRRLQDMGIILAINSNRTTDSIRYYADRHFSDIDFLSIEGHNPEYPSKPDPLGVNNIIRKAGVAKEETVYIGDSSTDIKTAKNAGIDCVIVRWGYGNEDDYDNHYPTMVIDEIAQLNQLI